MSALNLSTQVPNSIVTVEQNFLWSALTLGRINPSLQYLETDTIAQYVIQNGIYTAADNSYRFLVRASIPLDPNFMTDKTKKLWMFANEFSSVQIPAAFTTN